jgi:hypothetical protein
VRWVIFFLVLVVAAMFYIRWVRPHAAPAPAPPPEQHSRLVTGPGPALASVARAVGLESAVDVTAPRLAPLQAAAGGSATAAAASGLVLPEPGVATEEPGAAADEQGAVSGAAPGAGPAGEGEDTDEDELALPLVEQIEGRPGPRFRPLEPPPSNEDVIGVGAGRGTVPERIGVDPLPGERSALGAGQSQLGVR